MKLLIAIIKDYRKVEDILMGFLEHDVSGATVIEAKAWAKYLGIFDLCGQPRLLSRLSS